MTETEQKIIKLYVEDKLSCLKIEKILGINHHAVRSILKKNNIERRTLSESHITKTYDRNFFKTIDTEAKAYFLGFFYADGNVHKNVFQICLHPQDEHILAKFKECLKSDDEIRNDREYKRFGVRSEEFANDLRRLGCVDRKTFILKFPESNVVPDHLLHHFMRGYFDGDGCIKYQEKTNYIHWNFSITSCFDFLQEYQRILAEKCNLSYTSLRMEKRRINPIYYLEYGSTNNKRLLNIFDFLYKDATIYLFRKYNKFVEINDKILKRIEIRRLNPNFIDESNIEKIKLTLIENKDKSLEHVCNILNRKSTGPISNLYKKFGIERSFCRKYK